MKKLFIIGMLVGLLLIAMPAMAVAANYAFTPNMGDASVSKLDAATNTVIARYYTAPRFGQVINNPMATTFGVPEGAFPVQPADWRTSRLIVGPNGDVWVLNTGADCFIPPEKAYLNGLPIQGTLVRIEGETIGLKDTNGDGTIQTSTGPNSPFTFGMDDAVQVFKVGGTNDIPRTVTFDNAGNLWIGFHMALKKYGYFQKYTYDACTKQLNPVGDPVTTVADASGFRYDIAPYNADIDKNGILWFASYGSARVGRNSGTTNSDDGMYSFDTDDAAPVITKYPMTGNSAGTAYGVLVDDSPTDPNVKVYATSLEASTSMWIYDSSIDGAFTPVTVTGASGMRGLAFDNYGRVWIASSSNGKICWYNPGVSNGCSGSVGSTPVGVGIDATGDMWGVIRDSNKLITFTPPVPPTEPTVGFTTFTNVVVGPQPYVYGDFIREPVTDYQICGYKYNANTDAGWAGWTMNLYKKVGGAFPTDPIDTEVTDVNGHYCFTGLDAGYYKVTETINAELGYPVDPATNERLVTLPDPNFDACDPTNPPSYDFTNLPITTECATGWAAPTSTPLTPRFVPAPGDWATYVDTYDVGEGSKLNPVVYPIFAGQTYHAGDLRVYDSSGMLYVKYVPFANDDAYKPEYCGGWEMNAYHLQVVDEFDGFNPYRTVDKKTGAFKNIIPGLFDIKYKGDLIPGTDYIEIPISGFGDLDLYIAAHAGMCWQGYPCDVFDPTPTPP